jgi:hypothetical protein
MAVLYDARGNELVGALDQVGGVTITDGRTAGATFTALNNEILMDLNGQAVATFDLRTAAASLTLVFEATIDGTNYFGLPGLNVLTEAYLSSVIVTTTQTTQYVVGCSGFRRIRCRCSAFVSGSIVVTARASRADAVIYAKPLPSTLIQTATAAVNTGATATLPAAGAGLFHYITRIELIKLYNVIGVAAGAGVIITSTNLASTNPSWTTEQNLSAAGTVARVIDLSFCGNPLKSLVANTATTFVAGAQLQTIWRWNVMYYVGA